MGFKFALVTTDGDVDSSSFELDGTVAAATQQEKRCPVSFLGTGQ